MSRRKNTFSEPNLFYTVAHIGHRCIFFYSLHLQLGLSIAEIRVVRIQNLQLEFLPQKSELCAFQNLEVEFLPQKSELCATREHPQTLP